MLAAATALAGVAGCTSGGGTTASSSPSGSASTSTTSPLGTLQEEYESVVRSVLPSVVQISTSTGLGSGVVFDSKGDIVTNAHVVGSAKTLTVSHAGSKSLKATVVGVFAPDDLAVIRVTSGAGSLRPATFGKSSQVVVGEIVLAMGNPLGLTGSVTEGIVSATHRTVSEGQGSSAVITSAIQTSAAINPGNSGGALVNLSSEVIGIPTLAVSDPQLGGAAQGIGFAIPSDTVTSIANQLITKGTVTNSGRAELGIEARTSVNGNGQPAGVTVARVLPGGPAAKAGIRSGDIVLAVNGRPTMSVTALQAVLAGLKPGDRVPVKVSSSGSQHTVSVTLGSLTGG